MKIKHHRFSVIYAALALLATAGSSPIVYAIGNRGAALLSEVDGTPRAKVDWTDKKHT
jgi:hypothetical protein